MIDSLFSIPDKLNKIASAVCQTKCKYYDSIFRVEGIDDKTFDELLEKHCWSCPFEQLFSGNGSASATYEDD